MFWYNIEEWIRKLGKILKKLLFEGFEKIFFIKIISNLLVIGDLFLRNLIVVIYCRLYWYGIVFYNISGDDGILEW